MTIQDQANEIIANISSFLSGVEYLHLSSTSPSLLSQLEDTWHLYQKQYFASPCNNTIIGNWKTWIRRRVCFDKTQCFICQQPGSPAVRPWAYLNLCQAHRQNENTSSLISKSYAKDQFCVRDIDISHLLYLTKGKSKLYFEEDVLYVALQKHGALGLQSKQKQKVNAWMKSQATSLYDDDGSDTSTAAISKEVETVACRLLGIKQEEDDHSCFRLTNEIQETLRVNPLFYKVCYPSEYELHYNPVIRLSRVFKDDDDIILLFDCMAPVIRSYIMKMKSDDDDDEKMKNVVVNMFHRLRAVSEKLRPLDYINSSRIIQTFITSGSVIGWNGSFITDVETLVREFKVSQCSKMKRKRQLETFCQSKRICLVSDEHVSGYIQDGVSRLNDSIASAEAVYGVLLHEDKMRQLIVNQVLSLPFPQEDLVRELQIRSSNVEDVMISIKTRDMAVPSCEFLTSLKSDIACTISLKQRLVSLLLQRRGGGDDKFVIKMLVKDITNAGPTTNDASLYFSNNVVLAPFYEKLQNVSLYSVQTIAETVVARASRFQSLLTLLVIKFEYEDSVAREILRTGTCQFITYGTLRVKKDCISNIHQVAMYKVYEWNQLEGKALMFKVSFHQNFIENGVSPLACNFMRPQVRDTMVEHLSTFINNNNTSSSSRNSLAILHEASSLAFSLRTYQHSAYCRYAALQKSIIRSGWPDIIHTPSVIQETYVSKGLPIYVGMEVVTLEGVVNLLISQRKATLSRIWKLSNALKSVVPVSWIRNLLLSSKFLSSFLRTGYIQVVVSNRRAAAVVSSDPNLIVSEFLETSVCDRIGFLVTAVGRSVLSSSVALMMQDKVSEWLLAGTWENRVTGKEEVLELLELQGYVTCGSCRAYLTENNSLFTCDYCNLTFCHECETEEKDDDSTSCDIICRNCFIEEEEHYSLQ